MAARKANLPRLAEALLFVAVFLVAQILARPGLAWDPQFELVIDSGEKSVSFSLDDLAALPQETIDTHTMVTDGVQQFRGPLLRDVIEHAGFRGSTIEATALNDYLSRIPMRDIYDYDVIVAMEMNGKKMSVRDKGPLWIVYPRDDYRELQDMRYDGRWVWQLNRIHVR